jgi:DNA mismatch repair protein MutS
MSAGSPLPARPGGLPSAGMASDTPMQRQYREFRDRLPADALLLFRLGDFYELFGRDAEVAARVLGITLTRRHDQPMAGIPHHAAPGYVQRLLAAGHKVALADQVEAAVPGKLVRRALTRILTPGTALEEGQLDARRGNYLVAIAADRSGWHAAWIDVSTSDFRLASSSELAPLLPTLHALNPAEILLAEGHEPPAELAPLLGATRVSRTPGWNFDVAAGARLVAETLGVHGLAGFGLSDDHPALGAAGAAVAYVTDSLCDRPRNLSRIAEHRLGQAVLLDPASARNLELFATTSGRREGSLLEAIDRTSTPAGARLLARWLAEPTTDLGEVAARSAAVEAWVRHPGASARLGELLGQVRDLPRILGRLQNRLRNPRELGGVRDTLAALPAIREELLSLPGEALAGLAARVSPEPELAGHLASALADELPADLSDGGALRAGHDAELDRLRSLASDSKAWIAEFERAEQERTGIRSLKVRYNGAFGYAIEVTKANLHLVPADYIRKQTMVNAERFTTESLRAKEREVLRSDELALARETELFQSLVAAILARADALRETAAALAEADVLRGWAELAREGDWCRPAVDASDALEIDEGRHPVVERMLRERPGAAAFVPNDTRLAGSGEQVALITGPNMAGKSTYIRQVALIALLAHLGCHVPARRARIGRVDRIFCRVGASDELARGHSTFMVEMSETANILNNATPRSLVVLDEIGRGTSTYDGISIAWAVAEHLHGKGTAGPRTLFATHYHELTRLADTLPRLRNWTVAVREWKDEIVFVRRVVPGSADRSYGIQVARLAGMPGEVVARAREILATMEQGGGLPAPAAMPEPPAAAPRRASGSAKATTPAPAKPDKPSQGELFG